MNKIIDVDPIHVRHVFRFLTWCFCMGVYSLHTSSSAFLKDNLISPLLGLQTSPPTCMQTTETHGGITQTTNPKIDIC